MIEARFTATLYHCWLQNNAGGGTMSEFRKALSATVEIKYSRKNPNLDKPADDFLRKKSETGKAIRAFRANLNRADWKQPTNRYISPRIYLQMLLVWRFGALEHGATWKADQEAFGLFNLRFGAQGIWGTEKDGPYFRIRPKRPGELIKWIDAAIAADKDLQTEAQYVADRSRQTLINLEDWDRDLNNNRLSQQKINDLERFDRELEERMKAINEPVGAQVQGLHSAIAHILEVDPSSVFRPQPRRL